MKETTGSKQDSILFRLFLWLKNTVAILPSVQLDIFIVFWPWEIIWRDVRLLIKTTVNCRIVWKCKWHRKGWFKIISHLVFKWDTKLVSSISEFEKFGKQTNTISTQKTTGNHFASSRVGGHRITSSENQWEAFRNTKHYRTSDSCFCCVFFFFIITPQYEAFHSWFQEIQNLSFFLQFSFFFFNRRTVAGATGKVAGDIAGRRRFLTTLVSYVMLAFSALHFPSIWLVTLKKSWNLIGNIF